MSCSPLAYETVWTDKPKFEDAERLYHERLNKLQWMNSSSKMGEPKSDLKADGLKGEVKETIPIEIKKMETIINAQPLEEKIGKEMKKNEKGAKATPEKKDGGLDEAKIGDKGKKKNKEDDSKDKEKQKDKENKKKPPKENKKNKEEKAGEDSKKIAVQPPQGNTSEETKSKDETSSEGADKKGNKKSKKSKNKKNQQAAGDEGSNEVTNKKNEKKETANEQSQKKKADKKESKKVNQHCLSAGKSTIADEIARARQHIKNTLESCDGVSGGAADSEVLARLIKLEAENKKLRNLADDVKKLTTNVNQLISRLSVLEMGSHAASAKGSHCSGPEGCPATGKTEEKSKKVKDDDDVDLFGSDDEEDADMLKIKADRLKQYEQKKAKKPGVIAKSNIILDVKPWDDETNMKTMEEKVRQVTCDGLLWGASKLVPLAYGIHKLQISCVIEDEKVSVDWLQEQIEANEDVVQSVDIAAFNKV